MRTCVGCRERAAKSELIRIVAVGDGAATALTLDPCRSAGGRGAHLHPSPACLDLASRRKAWSRALRVDGPVDDSTLRSYIRTVRATGETEGGSPTVCEHDGHDRSAAPPGAATDRKRSTRS